MQSEGVVYFLLVSSGFEAGLTEIQARMFSVLIPLLRIPGSVMVTFEQDVYAILVFSGYCSYDFPLNRMFWLLRWWRGTRSGPLPGRFPKLARTYQLH